MAAECSQEAIRDFGDDVGGDMLPGSGCGSDSQVRVVSSAAVSPDRTGDSTVVACDNTGEEDADQVRPGEMGNRASFKRDKRESRKERDIPEIILIGASPLPAEGSMFTLPGPAPTSPTEEAEQVEIRKVVLRHPDEVDTHSLSGSEGSPKGSRKHFIQVMMSTSPQVRRSLVLRRSVHLASPTGNDDDSVSLDEDRTPLALDPLEHEWMMCASDGEWGGLCQLLAAEPGLVLKKDFVTGFTCLHWAAKQGKPELIARVVDFAKRHDVPVSVDVRSNTGYTPLHVAAMHGHMEVVKLLVGAYGADVEVRDHSGRKACQYLTNNVSVDIQDIIGAYESSDTHNEDCRDGGRWRFSKVLQSNLKPLRLLVPNDWDSVDGEVQPRYKVLRRKSSLGRMKPKLQRLRLRTSQIVHSTTFRDTEEPEGSGTGSFKSRPKTHFFG
ncbi:ankyrin repeat domain-containing protein SOWAHC-like [Sebastes umbrosus]|uniref:ankyrin repeat domain-containing protein SOWAHC-like n=1 Tax=Sebastes umbrosus TaxID=72105 RepID=UPI00189FA0B4|nr:ankyrin repeat domain-containing protein SOWAHC-like [Sebastes umbrosus]